MNDTPKLTHPWLVAVWPGMGNVALSAGYYLLDKLGMHLIAEYEADDLFDVDHVEVKDGILQTGRRPRNRLFLWTDLAPVCSRKCRIFSLSCLPPRRRWRSWMPSAPLQESNSTLSIARF